MKFAVYIVAVALWTGCVLSADSITLSSGASWSSFNFNSGQPNPTMGSQGTPFWNNWSYDTGSGGSHDMNIGYMLSGTGGFAGTDVLGSDSATAYATGGVNNVNGDPSAFTFTPNSAQDYTVTLLGAYSGNSTMQPYGTQFGIYYQSGNMTVYDELYGPGANSYTYTTAIDLTGSGVRTASSYGFYATVCYGAVVGGVCQNTETYYSDSSRNSGYVTNNPGLFPAGGAAYNHFTVFGLASDSGNYGIGNWVIGFKDGPVSAEGMGDFNDIVIELADPSNFLPPTPEPATAGIVGAGLAAFLFLRRRAAR
jgi:hypothetical protein